MRGIALTHTKGGVGKTATTQNLSAALGMKGFRVLMVDMDRQMTLTAHSGFKEGSELLPSILTGDKGNILPFRTSMQNVDIITGNGGIWELFKRRRIDIESAGLNFKSYMESLRSRYDYLLLDGPPSWGALNEVMLFATDEIIIPCKPTEGNLLAIRPTLNDVDSWLKEHPWQQIRVRRVLWTQIRKNELSEYMIDRLKGTDISTFQTIIRHSQMIERAETFHETIFTFSPRSAAAIDYKALAEELLNA